MEGFSREHQLSCFSVFIQQVLNVALTSKNSLAEETVGYKVHLYQVQPLVNFLWTTGERYLVFLRERKGVRENFSDKMAEPCLTK